MQQEDLQSLFFHAVQAHQQGNLQEAEQRYRAVLEQTGDHPRVLANLAALYRDQDRLEKAENCCLRALNTAPDEPSLLLNYGAVLEAQGRIARAGDCFRRVLELDPANPVALNNMGKTLLLQNDLEGAARHLERAIRIRPEYGLALNNLGVVYSCMQRYEQALQCFRRCLRLDPENTEFLYNLGGVYCSQERTTEALRCMEQVLRLDPGHASAQHLRDALTGRTTDKAPDSYVTEVFDRYASRFEDHIQDTLRYTVPADLRRMLEPLVAPGSRFARLLDLGCGTGLAGLAFADLADHLTGVDLSSEMLRQAEKKKIYHRLHCRELCDFLRQYRHRPDLVLATDVLIYSGDLAPLFSLLQKRLRPGGLFLFSIELAEESGHQEYLLRNSGRYAHALSYISTLTDQYGFKRLSSREQGIRKERKVWIKGMLFILEKESPRS